MALRNPRLLLGPGPGPGPGTHPRSCSEQRPAVIPPGASCGAGLAGMALGAAELAGQVARGELPRPDRIYCALGSGGVAAGLALGFLLCGLDIPVHAVAVVERPLCPASRLRALMRDGLDWLAAKNSRTAQRVAALTGAFPELPVRIIRGHVGRGYGIPTRRSLAACERLAALGLTLEPIYTGKAMGALIDEFTVENKRYSRERRPQEHQPHEHHSPNQRGRKAVVLFWHTMHQAALPSPAHDWAAHLPPSLRRVLTKAGYTLHVALHEQPRPPT